MGLRWVGQGAALVQCSNGAMVDSKYCGVHAKHLTYGDIESPKDPKGCPPYLPTTKNKPAMKYWAGLKQKLASKAIPKPKPNPQALEADANAHPMQLPLASNPVDLLLGKILQHVQSLLLSSLKSKAMWVQH